MRRPSSRGAAGLRFGRRRSRRLPTAAAVLAVVGAGAVLARSAAAGPAPDVPPAATPQVATTDLRGDLEAALRAASQLSAELDPTRDGTIPQLPEVAEVEPSPLLGTVGGLELFLPSAEPVIVGYHEAAAVSAVPVRPVGQLDEDRNTTRTDLPGDATAGRPYLVLSSRGRAAGPTSAADVVMRDDDPVLAAVTGTVVDVRSYLLYGSHQDQRIEIVPADRDDVRVVMIHVRGAQVAIGDVVVGGVTPVAASVRRFPFSSQVDRETEPERLGHVHLEVQPRDAPRFGDDDEDGDDQDGDADEVAGG